jgi:hypothetical protein
MMLDLISKLNDLRSFMANTYGYTILPQEAAESCGIFLVALFVSAVSGYYLMTHKVSDKSRSLRLLKDDSVDEGMVKLFGFVLLLLVAVTAIRQPEAMQYDVACFHVLLATTAICINNSLQNGLLFTMMSYSSWYGWYRLLLTTPIDGNYMVMIQPQWLSALFAFTSPTLAATLKYPMLIQYSGATLSYGALLGSLLVAVNAVSWIVDVVCMVNSCLPNYDQYVTSPTAFKLYGSRTGIVVRVYYFAGMAVLQYLVGQIPHALQTVDSLQQKLSEQEMVDELTAKATATGAGSSSDGGKDGTGRRKQHESSVNNSTGSAENSGAGGRGGGAKHEIALDQLPDDCTEISAEEAIRLDERGYQTQPKDASEQDKSRGGSASAGVRHRKAASTTGK